MSMRTRVTEILEIEQPVLCAGIPLFNVELVAAVSNAGGLGILGATSLSPDEIRERVDKLAGEGSELGGVDGARPSPRSRGAGWIPHPRTPGEYGGQQLMRVFVRGATGVVGRRAVPLLLVEGHSVTALVRRAPPRKRLEEAGGTCVAVDLFDLEALTRVVPGHDAVDRSGNPQREAQARDRLGAAASELCVKDGPSFWRR
jgi:hypothetical protein